ncbi:MAG: hypothetical protein ABI323_06620, partial [Solirubrobacteraceae bacterium]
MAQSAPPPPAASPDPEAPRRRTRAPGAYLNLPLWQRYAISLFVAAVLLTGMVLWVRGHNTDSAPSNNDPAATLRANREAEILVAQDQAPRYVSLPAGVSSLAALEHVIHARLAAQVASGAVSGPLERARCRATGARSGARRGYSCTIESGSVIYPFLAAVDTAARR